MIKVLTFLLMTNAYSLPSGFEKILMEESYVQIFEFANYRNHEEELNSACDYAKRKVVQKLKKVCKNKGIASSKGYFGDIDRNTLDVSIVGTDMNLGQVACKYKALGECSIGPNYCGIKKVINTKFFWKNRKGQVFEETSSQKKPKQCQLFSKCVRFKKVDTYYNVLFSMFNPTKNEFDMPGFMRKNSTNIIWGHLRPHLTNFDSRREAEKRLKLAIDRGACIKN